MEAGALLDLIGKLGVTVGLVIGLWYAVLSPRKTHEGKPKSALLVPGWIHDEAMEEPDRIRVFYEKILREEQKAHDVRIQEWRGFRDEERARRKEAEQQREELLHAVKGLGDDVAVLLEMARVAAGDGTQPGTGSRKTGG